jgi:hypothetical protein
MNWTEHQNPTSPRSTLFEDLVYALGLEKRPDLWRHNKKLRAFAKQNWRTRYIPESFLGQIGLDGRDIEL